ncbi:hypothetical protein BpHYR1_023733, partial [Brachionus plicatilis]
EFFPLELFLSGIFSTGFFSPEFFLSGIFSSQSKKTCLIDEEHVKVDPNSFSSSVLSSGLVDQSGLKKDQLADYFKVDDLTDVRKHIRYMYHLKVFLK